MHEKFVLEPNSYIQHEQFCKIQPAYISVLLHTVLLLQFELHKMTDLRYEPQGQCDY